MMAMIVIFIIAVAACAVIQYWSHVADFAWILIRCWFSPMKIKYVMGYGRILENMSDAELDWLCEQDADSPIWFQQKFARGPSYLQ